MAGNNGHLGLLIDASKSICKDFVDLKIRPEITTLALLATEGLNYSPDEFNNIVYGRVAINDTFLLRLYRFLKENSPELCEKLLRKIFWDEDVYVGRIKQPPVYTEPEFRSAIHKLLHELSGLADMHAVHLEDNLLDDKEIDTELHQVDRLEQHLIRYKHSLLQRKANRYGQAHQLKLQGVG